MHITENDRPVFFATFSIHERPAMFLIRLQRIIITCLLLSTISTGLAQVTYELKDTTVIHRLDTHSAVFLDPTENITIDQVLTAEFLQRFSPARDLNFGYLKAAVWVKVVTKTADPGTEWYLEIPAPYLERVDFYQLQSTGTWRHSQAGYFTKQSLREISHTAHVVPIFFSEDNTSTVYIRIAGRSPMTFPLLAMEKERFHRKVRLEDLGYGIFFGILIVMFFYNLLLYLTLKQYNYMLYICTIVCTLLIFGSSTGYAGKFLWPEKPVLNFYAGRISLGVMVIFLSVFTVRFLEVKRYSLGMYYTLLALIPLSAIAMMLVATGILSSAGNNLITISTVLFMTTGIVCSLKGNKIANYFIAAWTVYLIGGLLLTLRNSGVLEFNFWTTHFVEIGAALETIIIAFALGDRFRRYKQEKEAAQLQALKVQLGANEKLERNVMERTEQLSKAYEELRSTLETNTLQTSVIESKNAELDAFFHRISHDLKGPITSLLGLSSLARLEVKDEQAREYLDRQYQQVQRLNNIVTGLINLTKLNHTELNREKIDFNKITDDCIMSLNGLPNFSNITFKKDIPDTIEFYSEWTLLNAILQNLIENAIKYSRHESPYVRIAVRVEAEWTFIEVEDNGQGISAEHLPKIFEMFYRATNNAEGTGLGLYILKRSVDRLKGYVNIISEVGVGSTFVVKLPSMEE
jgi:signal transduction histidine kinase